MTLRVPQRMILDGSDHDRYVFAQLAFKPEKSICEESMSKKEKKDLRSISAAWAHFRFAVVGSLLSAPPARGELKAAIEELAEKEWTHPIHGKQVRFSNRTIARWYYKARRERDNPVRVLRRTVRKDAGRVSLAPSLAEHLHKLYEDYPHWTYQLHYDNLTALVKQDPTQGPLSSYSTVLRYMKAHGLVRKPRPQPKRRAGEVRAERRRQEREVRSYEAEYVGSLWHLDFHHSSLKVLTSDGNWHRPIALGILDDRSRLCCHLQWYLSESTEDLVHGLSQAIQKRGLPRALLTDNGPAMVSDEFCEGLLRLSVSHERTLPYSPYQNGKQEAFWGTLEGRLMEMLGGCEELTLAFLNQATQAWTEIEYNRVVHRETKMAPVERWLQSPDVMRASPSSDELRDAFRREVVRIQRQTDGTISLEGCRFEIPARYRHFREVVVRYARWDLGRVDLVDRSNDTILSPIYPLDRTANADGHRAVIADASDDSQQEPQRSRTYPPLLQRLLDEYAAAGTPPAYLPKPSTSKPTSKNKRKGTES